MSLQRAYIALLKKVLIFKICIIVTFECLPDKFHVEALCTRCVLVLLVELIFALYLK